MEVYLASVIWATMNGIHGSCELVWLEGAWVLNSPCDLIYPKGVNAHEGTLLRLFYRENQAGTFGWTRNIGPNATCYLKNLLPIWMEVPWGGVIFRGDKQLKKKLLWFPLNQPQK